MELTEVFADDEDQLQGDLQCCQEELKAVGGVLPAFGGVLRAFKYAGKAAKCAPTVGYLQGPQNEGPQDGEGPQPENENEGRRDPGDEQRST